MFKATRAAVVAVAAIALGAVLVAARAHAEDDYPGVAGSVRPQMQDCDCWDDFLEQLQEEQPDGSSKSDDAATS
jgi:hypothetical protein